MFKLLIYTTSVLLVLFTLIAVTEDMGIFSFFGIVFTPVWFSMLYILQAEDPKWMSK